MLFDLITVLGPTAVGKTRLAALLAAEFDGEIISADSRQVYKRMDIGTGKDLNDYVIGEVRIPYHLIDIIEPGDEFTLFEFNKKFYDVFDNIKRRNKTPLLCGGTALYINSILSGYKLHQVEWSDERYNELDELSIEELQTKLKQANPHLHNTTDLKVKDRVIKAVIVSEQKPIEEIRGKRKLNSLVIGINPGREQVKLRITKRLNERLKNGMIDEVEILLTEGITPKRLELFGLEYRYIGRHLQGALNYNDMFQKLNSAIHSFAKRQMTWFRKMEREGIIIHWLSTADFITAKNIIVDKYFK